jgi:hypothetical protein
MAEKNGWPFSLLGHMQGDAIRGDVGLLGQWAVNPPKPFALVTRPSRRLAPTAVPPARKERREIADFEIAGRSHRHRVSLLRCKACGKQAPCLTL